MRLGTAASVSAIWRLRIGSDRRTTCAGFARALLAGLLACGLNGCATLPSGKASSYIGEADNGRHIQLAKGRTLTVRLPVTPGTGYSWNVAALQPRVLQPAGSELERAAEVQPGTSATQMLTFDAVGAGDSPLVLEYRRPWERGDPAAKVFRLNVQVR